MRIGKVVAPGPVVKLAITRSSSDSVKASMKPASTAGRISGSVTVEKSAERRAAEIHRRLLQAPVERHQPRLHDHGDEAHGQHGMRQRGRPDMPRSMSTATNSSSSASPMITSGITIGA